MPAYLASRLGEHETQSVIATQASTSGLRVQTPPSSIWTVIGTDPYHKRIWRYMVRARSAAGAVLVANTQRPKWVSRHTLRAQETDIATEPLLDDARRSGFLNFTE